MPHFDKHFLLHILWAIDEKSERKLFNIKIIVKHKGTTPTHIILNIIYVHQLYFVKIWKSNLWNNIIYGTTALQSPFIWLFTKSIKEFLQSSKFKQLTCSLKILIFKKEITQICRVYISHLYILIFGHWNDTF